MTVSVDNDVESVRTIRQQHTCFNFPGSGYFMGEDDELGFNDGFETPDTHLPIDKLDLYVQSDNTYTR